MSILLFLRKNIFYVFLFFIILFCIKTGLAKSLVVNFFPINGDFQTYNAVRRLLDFQIPFRDFPVYLGLGPLFINALPLALFNSFGNSVFWANALSALCLNAAILTVFYLVLKNKSQSAFLVMCIVVARRLMGVFAVFYGTYIYAGTSLRTQRLFVPFLQIIIILLLVKYKNGFILEKFKKLSTLKQSAFAGAFAAFFVFWSNDYGFCSAASFSVLYLFWLLQKFSYKQTFKNLLAYGAGGLACFLLAGFILTGGHLLSYISAILDVASYQLWYFGDTRYDKTLVLGDFLFFKSHYFLGYANKIALILAFFPAFGVFYKVWRKKQVGYADYFLSHIFLTLFAAAFVYRLKSGGEMPFVPLAFFAWCVVIAMAFKWFMQWIQRVLPCGFTGFIKNKTNLFVGIAVLVSAISLAAQFNKAFRLARNKQSFYVKELGARLSKYGPELLEIKKDIDAPLFSVYASAQEVVLGQFQPTGFDYIIHALGDKNRKKYLETFKKGNYKYVSTVNYDINGWEVWIERANWFFYRELYASYRPFAVYGYSVVWKPSLSNVLNVKAEATAEKLSSGQTNIAVKLPDALIDAVADVEIAYTSKWNKNRLKMLAVNKLVGIFEGPNGPYDAGCFFIPPSSEQIFIPVEVKNGKGNITLAVLPLGAADLEISGVKVNAVFSRELLTLKPF